MLKKIVISFLVFVSASMSFASDNESSGFVSAHILKILQEEKFDLYDHVTSICQARLRNLEETEVFLSSPDLEATQLYDFVRSQDPEYAEKLIQPLLLDSSGMMELTKQDARSIRTINNGEDPKNGKDQLRFSKKLGVLKEIRVWRYMHKSLAACCDTPDLKVLVNILREFHSLQLRYENAIGSGDKGKDKYCTHGSYYDNFLWSSYLLDAFALHILSKNVEIDQDLNLFTLLYAHSDLGEIRKRLGEIFLANLDFIPCNLSQKLLKDDVIVESSKRQDNFLWCATNNDFTENYMKRMDVDSGFMKYMTDNVDQSHISRLLTVLIYDRSFEAISSYFISPEHLDFETFRKLQLSKVERREVTKNASSFLVGTVVAKKDKKKKNQNGKKKKNKKNNQLKESIISEPLELAPKTEEILEVVMQSPKAVEKKTQISKLQKKQKKKQTKEEERLRVLSEFASKYERNKTAVCNQIKDITIQIEEGFVPTIDELRLYQIIWSPESKRTALSWKDLLGQLKSFGWSMNNKSGSLRLLMSPSWLGKVKVIGEGGVPIYCSSIMVHQPHQESLRPIPEYVITFFRLAMERNLGLSNIMVEALIKKVSARKK